MPLAVPAMVPNQVAGWPIEFLKIWQVLQLGSLRRRVCGHALCSSISAPFSAECTDKWVSLGTRATGQKVVVMYVVGIVRDSFYEDGISEHGRNLLLLSRLIFILFQELGELADNG